jgi:hypothetical protein
VLATVILDNLAYPSGPREVKLDENLPLDLLDDLRAAGHEADGLRDEGLIGASDDVALERLDELLRREPAEAKAEIPMSGRTGCQLPDRRLSASTPTS